MEYYSSVTRREVFILSIANLFETDSSQKKTPVNSGRRAPITMYGDGPQLSPNMSHHLMQPSSGVDQFSFGHSFWQDHDDEELKLADDSDNPSNHRHSLPVQDYHNMTKRKGSRNTKDIEKSGRSKLGSIHTLPNHNGDNCNFRTCRQLTNSSELPGDDHPRTVMSSRAPKYCRNPMKMRKR